MRPVVHDQTGNLENNWVKVKIHAVFKFVHQKQFTSKQAVWYCWENTENVPYDGVPSCPWKQYEQNIVLENWKRKTIID